MREISRYLFFLFVHKNMFWIVIKSMFEFEQETGWVDGQAGVNFFGLCKLNTFSEYFDVTLENYRIQITALDI